MIIQRDCRVAPQQRCFCLFISDDQKRRRTNETNFEELHRCVGCDTIHICVVRDGSAHRSSRRLLYYKRRSSSSWLRLSELGDVPGGIQRHRWYMYAQPLVNGPQRRPGLSAKTSAFASQASSREKIIRDKLRLYSQWCVPPEWPVWPMSQIGPFSSDAEGFV